MDRKAGKEAGEATVGESKRRRANRRHQKEKARKESQARSKATMPGVEKEILPGVEAPPGSTRATKRTKAPTNPLQRPNERTRGGPRGEFREESEGQYR